MYIIFVRFPLFTTEEKLQGFRGDVIHGKCKERFLSFMHRVMATEFADRENPASKMVELLTVDCLAELSPTLTAEIPLFSGSELVFLDVPKVRDVLNYQTYNRQFASQAKF